MNSQDTTLPAHDLEESGVIVPATTTELPAGTKPAGPTTWRCSKCGTEFCGTPSQRLLDARDRWRRDRCQHCGRTTVMERA